MTPTTRSTLKLDLKDLPPKPSTPHIGRIGLVMVSALAIVSTIASIDNPSAATANLDQLDRVRTSDLVWEPEQFERSTENQSKTSNNNVAGPDHSSLHFFSQTKQNTPRSHYRKEIKLAMMAPTPLRKYTTPAISMKEVDLGHSEARLPATNVESNIDGFKTELASVDRTLLQETSSGDQSYDHDTINSILGAVYSSIDDAPTAEGQAILPGTDVFAKFAPVESLSYDLSKADPQPAKNGLTDELFEKDDWKHEKVKKSDTLSQIFNRLGLSSKEAYDLVAIEQASPLKLIRPGQQIEVVTTPSAKQEDKEVLAALRYQLDKFSSLVVLRTEEGYQIETEVREPKVQQKLAQATIDHSLLGAAKKADIPYDIVYKLASIFGWQVDFARDIKSGDQIKVIYEELYLDEELIGQGEIIAAELLAADKQYRAIRHIDEEGHITYFAPDGDGIQGSFLRSPIKFARVTSKFSKRRFHPVLKKWKAHKGVDYGAPMKTPIMATGDGIVTLAGSKKGYGKTVIIRHGHKYQTLYAHMNSYAKGIKAGARVKQGDVIGYVGKTGWTTGTHLHYEFRLNGVHQNPLTVELPKSAPIDKKYETAFKNDAAVWVAALDRADRIPLAQNDL
ncbi:MAG: peptidoglycan DD-metalloendopeptidase family protein [Gammaproteobacteria bacterium]